jgi:hypothetical protein
MDGSTETGRRERGHWTYIWGDQAHLIVWTWLESERAKLFERIMHLQSLATVLTFGSAALAAQLTQVSNYGGSARAKPGMYISPSHHPVNPSTIPLLYIPSSILLTPPKVGLRPRQAPIQRPGRRNPLLPIFCPKVFRQRQNPLEARLGSERLRHCVAVVYDRMLGCIVKSITQS